MPMSPLPSSRPSGASGRALDPLARAVVETHLAAPAAVVGASVRVADAWSTEIAAAGRLGSAPGEPRATPETPFDLASVTKPVTALTVARLARRGGLSLATPLGALLAEARGTPSEDVSLELLLAHRAGLESHRPLYAPLAIGRPVHREGAFVEAARARRADAEGPAPADGFAPVYSDLGYLLAGEAVARAVGSELDVVMAREVFEPLGLALGSAARLRRRDATFGFRVAPTEVVPWRGGTVRGAVHDENAWALGGEGVSGHAGLFGTVEGVLALGRALLDVMAGRRDEFLTREELLPLVRPRPGGTLRAGFDGKSQTGSSAGQRFGPNSVGHLGFTGTSMWIDPERELAGVLLTNRVHPTRASEVIRQVRPLVYDELFDWSEKHAE
jgi:serine-type D-Ala-D-Ala carboxypeptidase